MKVKRLLTAMMAATLSFNFMACSDDESNNGNGGGAASGDTTKRLTKIFVQCPHGDTNNETVFQYDSEGRVSQMATTYDHHVHGDTWTNVYSYSYNDNNEVVVSMTYDNEPYETTTYALNDKGYATSGTKTRSSGGQIRQYTFSYTDNYLTLANETLSENSYEGEKNQIIADGLILPYDWDAVEYTEIPNLANLFFHYANESDIFDSFEYFELYWAGLAGKAPKYLPQSVTDNQEGSWNFSYKLDDEGYPTTITISDDSGTTTITCTYEEI